MKMKMRQSPEFIQTNGSIILSKKQCKASKEPCTEAQRGSFIVEQRLFLLVPSLALDVQLSPAGEEDGCGKAASVWSDPHQPPLCACVDAHAPELN